VLTLLATSKISFFLRLPNKIGAQGLTVKHAHGDGAPFTKATGVSLPAHYFDLDKGRVKDTMPNAADLNEQIHRVHNTVLKALGYCKQYGFEPTRALMEEWYDKVTTMREQLQAAQPKVKRINKAIVEGLREEVAALEAELVKKKAELLQAELATGEYQGHLLLHFFGRYALEKEELAANTHKIFRNVAGESACRRLRRVTMPRTTTYEITAAVVVRWAAATWSNYAQA
jgi:hypothetical protein